MTPDSGRDCDDPTKDASGPQAVVRRHQWFVRSPLPRNMRCNLRYRLIIEHAEPYAGARFSGKNRTETARALLGVQRPRFRTVATGSSFRRHHTKTLVSPPGIQPTRTADPPLATRVRLVSNVLSFSKNAAKLASHRAHSTSCSRRSVQPPGPGIHHCARCDQSGAMGSLGHTVM